MDVASTRSSTFLTAAKLRDGGGNCASGVLPSCPRVGARTEKLYITLFFCGLARLRLALRPQHPSTVRLAQVESRDRGFFSLTGHSVAFLVPGRNALRA